MSPAGSGTTSGTPLPPPQLSPPLPRSAGAGQGKRDRQLQENGGARLLLGAFRAVPSHVTRAPPLRLLLPPLFPSLSSSTPALPRSAREERGGARALRDGTRRSGATGGPPRGSARPPRHVTLPANRSPEAERGGHRGEVGRGRGGESGAPGAGQGVAAASPLSHPKCVLVPVVETNGLTKRRCGRLRSSAWGRDCQGSGSPDFSG